MKQFLRHKTLDEIKAQCEAQGLELDTRLFDQGDDCVVVRGGGAYVVYNMTSGNFYGETPGGFKFDNTMAELDSAWWYDAMLNFFMAEPV